MAKPSYSDLARALAFATAKLTWLRHHKPELFGPTDNVKLDSARRLAAKTGAPEPKQASHD